MVELVGKVSGCRFFKVACGVCVCVVCVCVGVHVGQLLRISRAGGVGEIFEGDVGLSIADGHGESGGSS